MIDDQNAEQQQGHANGDRCPENILPPFGKNILTYANLNSANPQRTGTKAIVWLKPLRSALRTKFQGLLENLGFVDLVALGCFTRVDRFVGNEAELVSHNVRNPDPVGFAATQRLGKDLVQCQSVARDNGVFQGRGEAVGKHLAAVGEIPARILKAHRREEHHQHDKHDYGWQSSEEQQLSGHGALLSVAVIHQTPPH